VLPVVLLRKFGWWTGLGSNSGPPWPESSKKTASVAPALFHIDEGGSKILRNVLYYSLFVGWDVDDFVADGLL